MADGPARKQAAKREKVYRLQATGCRLGRSEQGPAARPAFLRVADSLPGL